MNTSTTPQQTFSIEDFDDARGAMGALLLGPFVTGALPWARTQRLHRVKPDAPLLPSAGAVTRTALAYGRKAHVAEGPGWMLHVIRWTDGTADVTVVAESESTGTSIVDEVTRDATEPQLDDSRTVHVGFWHSSGRGVQRRVKSIAVDPWVEIVQNYPKTARDALDRLMTIGAPDVTARLILLHGPPGTGKTTALRALAHAWRKWCRFDYVLDPERLLTDSGYLMTVALNDDDDEDRWRLLLLEDCDELIRAEAKQGTGQSLARLLNLTDGLLGQGLEVIVAITTNEPLTRLHPAIVRPGRCLAHIEVGRFTRAEAADWLGAPATVPPEGATLAELFVQRGALDKVDAGPSDGPIGMYL